VGQTVKLEKKIEGENMSIKEKYPKLFEKIEDKEFVEDLNDLVNVDVNYDDEDSEEVDVFDPEDYNYIVYINERVQNAIGKKKLSLLKEKIQNLEEIENFIDSEDDLYGIKCDLPEDEIVKKIVDIIENELV
jgi:hypothetical protein